ncbi:MAG: DinB family protein [Gemmatimonadetes bacterium]|nr:DinB family protein [Gemmatimonadota bacterium]
MKALYFLSLFAVLGSALATAAPLGAQTSSLKEVQVADLRTMKDKFVALAEVFPEDRYDWRPMEGVRSVKEVLILLTGESLGFPTQWGAPAPAGVLPDRAAEGTRLQGLSKTALVAELGRAFDNIIGVVAGMDDATRSREIRFFGQPAPISGAILMATGDMHEHLGQLIAYARMNRIVPPWNQ